MKPLTTEDFARAGTALAVPPAAVIAVCQVEAPNGGFDSTGRPRILFEGHYFHRLTGGQYGTSHPTLSYPRWANHYAKGPNADARNAAEHDRLQVAVSLRRAPALMSASWGGFQIMGENYATAGFETLQDFVNAMHKDEQAHLDAFVEFVQHDRGGKGPAALQKAVKFHNWVPFAEFYNGPAQAKHDYAGRLAAAYDKACRAA